MSTRYRGSEEETRALDAFITLTRATNSVAASLAKLKAYDGLTVSQFGVLEALHHIGPLSQKDLARKLLKSSGNLVTVIDNLQQRGLVERNRLARDRRVIEVRLTDEGRQMITQLFPEHAKSILKVMSVLDEAELESLIELCRKLGRDQSTIL